MLVALLLLATTPVGSAWAQQRPNAFIAESQAIALAGTQSIRSLRLSTALLATTATSPVELCKVAELYKRLGDTRAVGFYERAIAAAPDEPAFELLFGIYLLTYRGAGQQPLFPPAERHLLAASVKLANLGAHEPGSDLDGATVARLRRALVVLHERDGLTVAASQTSTGHAGTGRPWLFLRSTVSRESGADTPESSDVRDLAAAAQFSQSASRLGRHLTQVETSSLVRQVGTSDVGAGVRVRGAHAPVIDISFAGRKASNAQVTNFFVPGEFNNVSVTTLAVSASAPLAVGATDVLVQGGVHAIDTAGRIEFLPNSREKILEYSASAALARYVRTDRISVSGSWTRQAINPEPEGHVDRHRQLMGGSVSYHIYRPTRGRSLNDTLGRHFQPRGIEIVGGIWDDREHYPDPQRDVLVIRRDIFGGVSVKGLKRVDVMFRPTWYRSSVDMDPTQSNSQLRYSGSITVRLLDGERTGGIPKEHVGAFRVASVELVVPFHWDKPQTGADSFASRSVGVDLWTKLFTDSNRGWTLLGVAGYGRQTLPGAARTLQLARASLSLGF